MLVAVLKPQQCARIVVTIVAILLVGFGVLYGGFSYWLALPARTIHLPVRGGFFVIGTPTQETAESLKKLDVSLDRYIDGNPHRSVDSFFTPESVNANELQLASYYVLFLAPTAIGIVLLLEWIPDSKGK